MAYKVIKATGSIHGIPKRTFICDSSADISNLPTNKKMGLAQSGDTVSDEYCSIGSVATVTDTGEKYELNASGVWTKVPSEGSDHTSDISIDKTLSLEGQAADAKAVGDSLANKVDTSALSNYVQTSVAESTYAKKTDLSGYLNEESADSKYASISSLSDYATSSTIEATYAKKTDLSEYVKTDALPKGAAVSDASGEGDASTQLNALLASLREAGIIANS